MHDIQATVARFRQWLRPGGRLVFNNPLVRLQETLWCIRCLLPDRKRMTTGHRRVYLRMHHHVESNEFWDC